MKLRKTHKINKKIMSKIFNRKSQMEIMGLVIIVVLITLGLLFAAIFSFNDETQKKVFTRKGLATSTMSAILKATAGSEEGCVQTYVGRGDLQKFGEDILEDCALHWDEYKVGENSYNALGFSEFSCNNVHSCEFFKDRVSFLLDETLGTWGKHYEFSSVFISSIGEPEPMFSIKDPTGKGCSGERDASGLFPIQVKFAGLVESQLFVCD